MTERMLGPVGSPRRRRFYGIPLAPLAAIVLVLGVSAAGGASLAGSAFEIDTDANLVATLRRRSTGRASASTQDERSPSGLG